MITRKPVTLEELYSQHIKSFNFLNLHRRYASENMSASKYDEQIITTRGFMGNPIESLSIISKIAHTMSREKNIMKLSNHGGSDELKLLRRSLKNETFVEGIDYDVQPRRDVEFNPNFIQLIVAAYIQNEDGDIMLLQTLPTTDGRIKDKRTLIQGHVTYTADALFETQKEFLERSIIRELQEELTLTDKMLDIITIWNPAFIIYDNKDAIGLEHFGFVYCIEVDNQTFNELQSNEPESHSTLVLSRESIDAGQKTSIWNEESSVYDGWSKLVLANI